LNRLSAWYHIAGVVLLVGALVMFAPKHDAAFLLTRFTNQPYPYVYGFMVGLLQAQWTYTGYDASAHVTEETVDPTRNAPWGTFLSVAVSGVAGYVMLLAVTIAIPDLGATAEAPNPFLFVLTHALPAALGRALVWVVIGAMWFCGLSSITSNSRMLFAFARDGGLPASGYVARVSPRYQSPHVAVWVSAAAAFVVGLWSSAYSAIVALSTIALYASYGMPILAHVVSRVRAARRIQGAHPYRDFNAAWGIRRGPWNLGRFSGFVQAVALAWIAIIMVLFVLPPNELAGETFGACLVALAIYWFGYMSARFRGPRLAQLDST
jgi:amino acid transporter